MGQRDLCALALGTSELHALVKFPAMPSQTGGLTG
jgi:hypothetical protein